MGARSCSFANRPSALDNRFPHAGHCPSSRLISPLMWRIYSNSGGITASLRAISGDGPSSKALVAKPVKLGDGSAIDGSTIAVENPAPLGKIAR